MKKKPKYDNAYKYIFSNKRIFCQLVQSFVYEDFVKEIDDSKVELVDKSFVSDEFLARESDIIYKIPLKEKDIYIYFLLEFQSTVDKSIPVRMLLYILQFYDLLFRNSKQGKLPSVFPALLYNGEKDWTVPENINQLIEHTIPAKYIPSFEYYKIIQKDIPDDVLFQIHNMASAIIYLEKQKDDEGMQEAIDNIITLIKSEQLIDIKMFTNWVKKMFDQRIDEETVNKINNLMEVKHMLTKIKEQIEEKGIKKGIKQGIEQGIEQGIIQGIEQGIIQGIKQAKMDDAKKMLEKGLSVDDIVFITGLSKKEVQQLQ